MSDLDRERYRRDDESRRRGPSFGDSDVPAFVGKVASPAASIAVGKFLLVNVVTILGAETEGGAATSSFDATRTVPVLLIGPSKPATGEYLICRFLGNRWVADRFGPSSTLVTTPGCPCSAGPQVIVMTAQGFDPGYYTPPLHSDILDWGTAYPNFGIGSAYWLGRTTFSDAPHSPPSYQYVISCVINTVYYVLRRRYTDMTTDPSSYKWTIGLAQNQCSNPWEMLNGSGNVAYPGFNMTLTAGS